MDSDLLLHIANFSALFIRVVMLTFPRLIIGLQKVDASPTWENPNALLLELTVLVVNLTYQMYYDYPPPTYMEYPVLIALQVIMVLSILHHNNNLWQSLIYTLVFVGAWRLLIVQKWMVDLAMSLCTLISATTALVPLVALWRSKDSSQNSVLYWGMTIYAYVARIYTTIMTTGDMQVLVRFIVLALLKLWVLLAVLHYRRSKALLAVLCYRRRRGGSLKKEERLLLAAVLHSLASSIPEKEVRVQLHQAQARGLRRSQTRPKCKSR